MGERIYDARWIGETVGRLADEVKAALGCPGGLAVVGIKTRGAQLAKRLHQRLAALGCQVELGEIDVTLYRDDLSEGGGRKAIMASDIPFDMDGKQVLLVDDVFGTGRTVRAALSELMDFGRPARVSLLCLVDRGGRELPIRPDFSGAARATGGKQRLRVRFVETDGVDEVALED